MTTGRSVFAVVLMLLLIAGGATACTCANGGSVVQRSPCQCQCATGYAQPNCEWRNDDRVDLIIVFRNDTGSRFSSGAKAEAIRQHYNPTVGSDEPRPYKVVRRRTATEPADASELHVIFRVRGDLVNALLVDGDAGPAQWMQDIGVLRVTLYTLQPSQPGSLAASPTLFTFTAANNTVPVPFGAVAWAMGGVITLVLMPVVEGILGALCFSTSNMEEEDVYPDAVGPTTSSGSPKHGSEY